MGSPSGSAGSSSAGGQSSGAGSSGGSGSSSGSTGGSTSSGASSGSDFGSSVSQAESSRSSTGGNLGSSGSDGSDSDSGGASPSSGPATDAGLTAAQSSALADGAAVMDGFSLSPAAVAPVEDNDNKPAEEKGVFERAGDAVVDTGELMGGVAVGAVETAWDGVTGVAGLAWEGVNMVNDAAGTVLDTAVGWTGIDAFEGHAQRNAARGQAMVDGVMSLPDLPGKVVDSVEKGWETFEDNWDSGNYYDAGRQIGSVGLEAATIAVPVAKADTLGKLSKVDDLAPAAPVALAAPARASTGLDDVLREIREAGAEVVTDKDPGVKAYLDDAARRQGIAPEDMHASTLGDTIVVRDHLKDDVVTLREELEHVRQQKEGRVSVGADGYDTRVDLEIEARERMLERDDLTPGQRELLQGEIDTIRERGRY